MHKKVLTYCSILGLATLNALSYQIFVFPNRFAPAGLNGICTMIQHVFGINMGYLYLLVNIPLAILVLRKGSRILAIRSMIYVSMFSLMLSVLGQVDLSRFAYDTANGTSTILGPLVAGIISGTCSSLLVQVCAVTGGTDFISTLIHKSHPQLNFFWISFSMNAVVAATSYFVYGFQIEPVILCILNSFTSSTVSDHMIKSGRSAVRYEIITEYPKEIANAIFARTNHSATLVPGRGMYQGKETNVLICVINKSQIPIMSDIVKSQPKTFAVISSVTQVVGNFKHMKNDGKEANNILDEGDGPAI